MKYQVWRKSVNGAVAVAVFYELKEAEEYVNTMWSYHDQDCEIRSIKENE